MSWTSRLILLLCCSLHSPPVTASVVCSVNFGSSGNGNVTSLDPDGRQDRVSLISCSRGCCPDSSDGCCYRTTEDVIVYTVPVCVFLVVIIIVLCCIFKRLRDNRRRAQDKQNKHVQDNPPSYSSCVHPVSSTTTLNLVESETTVEIVIHPPPIEEEENTEGGNSDGGLLPPPPVYDDMFKRVEDDQVPVVSISGHVSFVDHALIPAIKISLSQNDLQSKLLDGMRPCRSSNSLAPSYRPKVDTETDKSSSGDAPVESCQGVTLDAATQAVQKYENKVVFMLGGVDQNTHDKD